jgi:2-oxoglutarate dehydrogenase E1 component
MNLIQGYRQRGHLFTKTNPVRDRRQYTPSLDIQNFGLTAEDLETVFQAGTEIGIGPAKLKDIIDHLHQTYCQSIGAEYRYLREPATVKWLQTKMESGKNSPDFSLDKKKHLLHKLNQAVVFENFLHTKFVGQKRFSLEGAETTIPALDTIIERGADLGIQEFVIGMAHRGRLNVLANILNKTYEQIFREFEGGYFDNSFDGDVKYHLGYSSDVKTTTKGETVHLTLTPNPSHLETVDPVVEGIVKAKLTTTYEGDLKKIAPILIHGDASVAGQGIVYEVIQMSLVKGYRTGGTIHLVINNQVGFTTNYLQARSSTYCTDVAKVTLSPVFHVNGDDVEAVAYAVGLAVEFRQQFHHDVFIDLLCYRKHGHNEGDEPRITQPLLYKIIASHPNPREIYIKKLLATGALEEGMAKEMEQNFRKMLQERLDESKQLQIASIHSFLEGKWKGLRLAEEKDFDQSPETAVSVKELKTISQKLYARPEGLKFFNKLEKVLDDRRKMVEETDALDWGMAETLAYGSLVNEGFDVRISGQDVERGTFSHRHAIMKVEDSEQEYIPLQHIREGQGRFHVFNSILSEYGVLGFEYGHSLAAPNCLTIWEAQYGDFFNGAQIIIDQYVAAAETKWQRMSGLVMLLPHGYEGSGPEHSSARIERFLELCANNNIQVANCTVPANYFHLLRRQLHRPFRKPLIVFTPKGLLRHPKCISSLKDFAQGGFKEVLDDTAVQAAQVKRVLFCTGKIYYELLDMQQKHNRLDVAIVRLEQLYPLPENQIQAILAKYKKATDCYWVQEEPENMGAWTFIMRKFATSEGLSKFGIQVISRKESSSPATGSPKQHASQQEYILNRSFDLQPEKSQTSGKLVKQS